MLTSLINHVMEYTSDPMNFLPQKHCRHCEKPATEGAFCRKCWQKLMDRVSKERQP